MLRACAFREEESRGRRFPEPPHPYRGEFQRDRDRIIHARAFRRLENKTQVFTRRFSDHFRTRLTHTLEVAQISRTVARALELNQDLVEALALAHDIGHPPFGHSGEQALDRVMREFGEGFEHNLHALRIVEAFERRYIAFPGLNLTFEVREGLIKHSRDYDPAAYPQLAEYLLELRPPLEAQLLDLTDEISYDCADLDDGREAGLLNPALIAAELPCMAEWLAGFARRYPQAPAKLRFNEANKRLLDGFVTDLIQSTAASAAACLNVGQVRACPARLAGFSPAMEKLRRELKAFLSRNLYNHPSVHAEKQRAESVVESVFRRLLADPGRLPPSYRRQAGERPLHRVVCDYLAGMTDNFISRLHRELCA